MARGIKASFTLDPKSTQLLGRTLKKLQVAALPAGHVVMGGLNDIYFQRVQMAYRQGRVPGGSVTVSAKGTLEKRAQGKSEGASPAIPKYASKAPLVRSGTLAGLIRRAPSASGNSREWRTFVQAGVPLPHGGISDKVAKRNEAGATITFVATTRQRVYLRALMLGVAGTDQKVFVRPGNKQITIRIPPRPIWAATFAAVMGGAGPHIAQHFSAEMSRRTGLKIRYSAG